MDLIEHFRLIWRRRWIILVVAVVVAGVVFARSRSLDEVYGAEAVVDVISSTSSETGPLTQEQVDILTGRVAALVETTTVLRDGAERSGLDIDVDTARGRVSGSDADSPGFVNVMSEGPSRRAAERLTDGMVAALVDATESPGDASEGEAVTVVSPARAQSGPIAPTPERDATLAFLLAFVVSAEGAALAGLAGDRLSPTRVREEVERVASGPVLARVPRRGRDETIEAFRELRAQVGFAGTDLDIRSIAVTGIEPGCGSSFVARGLAQISANLKGSVILVDANLRRPGVASALHLPPSPGLGDVLLGTPFDPALLRQANPLQKRFRVLTAGLAVPDAPGLLGAGAFRKILDQMPDAELVLIDTPSVMEAADALVIASQCDASLLVVDARKSRRRTIRNAAVRLQPHARILGTVINRVDAGKVR